MSPEFERVITANWGDDSVRSLAGYEAKGGFVGLRLALQMAPDDVIQVVKDSGLRGRGGAGFPTGMKWSFVPQDTGKPTYVTVNFDESEPGTCNNRELMEREPHQMLEGAMIAAYAIRCHTVFVYCRGEFLWPGTVVQRAIAELYAAGYAGQGHPGLRLRPRHRAAPRRRRVHLRRGDRAALLARRASAASHGCVRRSPPWRACTSRRR